MEKIAEFYQWEKESRDAIHVKRIYIDMADDLVAGLMLSQIIYWNLLGKNGQRRLRVQKQGYWWLAKARTDWWEECRLTPKQVDRAIKLLKSKQLIITAQFKFNGAPTTHIRLNEQSFLQALNRRLNQDASKGKIRKAETGISPKQESRLLPKGEFESDQRENSLTDNTSYISTDTTNTEGVDASAFASASPPIVNQLSENSSVENHENLNSEIEGKGNNLFTPVEISILGADATMEQEQEFVVAPTALPVFHQFGDSTSVNAMLNRDETRKEEQRKNHIPRSTKTQRDMFRGAKAEVKQRLFDRSQQGREYPLSDKKRKQEMKALDELIDQIKASEEDAWNCYLFKKDKETKASKHGKSFLAASWELVNNDFSEWVEQGRPSQYKVPGLQSIDLRGPFASSGGHAGLPGIIFD